jgi:hypothetical protein
MLLYTSPCKRPLFVSFPVKVQGRVRRMCASRLPCGSYRWNSLKSIHWMIPYCPEIFQLGALYEYFSSSLTPKITLDFKLLMINRGFFMYDTLSMIGSELFQWKSPTRRL